MSAQSGAFSSFSLYDFFSVFLPGVFVLLCLTPLLQTELLSALSTAISVGLILVGGFIIGQAIHGVAVEIQDLISLDHRDIFHAKITGENRSSLLTDAITQDTSLDAKEEELFKKSYSRRYLDDEQDDVSEIELPDSKTLYRMVRSDLAIESRGKGRHLQAIYAFCRSSWIGAAYLLLFYTTILIVEFCSDSQTFQSYYGSLVQSGSPMALGIPILLAMISIVFLFESGRYKSIFVDYLITDFVNIQTGSSDR